MPSLGCPMASSLLQGGMISQYKCGRQICRGCWCLTLAMSSTNNLYIPDQEQLLYYKGQGTSIIWVIAGVEYLNTSMLISTERSNDWFRLSRLTSQIERHFRGVEP